ncbi:hypothetical protein FS842_003909 [Serendipita sp. 407]|nr:hypothetical protein FS842_003909 [Serendipita sp. 407]
MSYAEHRPLGDVRYNQINASSSNYYDNPYQPPARKPKSRRKWLLIGLPILLIVVIAAIVGGVVGSRKSNNGSSSSSNGGNSGQGSADGAHSSLLGVTGRFPIGTDAYFMPVYPSTTDTAAYGPPTVVNANNPSINWPQDSFTPSGEPGLANIRPDRPRLIAGKYKIQALPTLMQGDPYLKQWDDIIMKNATFYKDQPSVVHVFDGGPSGSGILDPAREVKQRIKHFAYAYLKTSDTSWIDATYRELQNAISWADDTSQAGNDPTDPWNSAHFLDTAELTAAFAIAYDWLYDHWSDDQKNTIRTSIINFGLAKGAAQYAQNSFWLRAHGNWNCVSNSGIVMGCLAIQGDDTTGACNTLFMQAINNANANCAFVPTPNGSGAETPNYWYFAMTGWAEMASSLMLSTGSDFGIVQNNPSFNLTALYHMYVTGMTSLFDYGDHGPNKFSTTDTSLFFMGDVFNQPRYTLWQRDRFTSAEPWSMFWYNPAVSGAWWNGLPLDHLFDDDDTRWGSMRSSWTDNTGIYVAMKASNLTIHQTHGDLDCGDFVLDALGERWAGELGSADYLGANYFASEAQDAVRWLWYRKMTEGQNTLSIAGANQNVNALPAVKFDTSGTTQGATTVADISTDSTAYMTADLTSAYDANIKRGIRFINGRRQVLLQDELTGVNAVTYWRMHTNATVTIDGNTANLSLNGKSLQVTLIDPPANLQWQTLDPVRTDDAPQLQTGQEADQPNPGVTVLSLSIPAGTHTIQVLFNPQWDGFSDFQTPPTVALDSWTLTSH